MPLRCPSVGVGCLRNTWLSLQDLDGGQPPQLIKWKVGETPFPLYSWAGCLLIDSVCLRKKVGIRGKKKKKKEEEEEGKVHAKSLQSCPILCDPMDSSPPGSSVHGDSPGKNTGVGCCALLQRIFLTQESNLRLVGLLHWQAGSYH